MTVSAILRVKGSKVVTIRPDVKVGEAIRVLVCERIGALVVTDTDSTVLGLVSERDVIDALGIRGAVVLDMRVRDLMSITPACQPDDSLENVMARMTYRRLRHLVVLEDGALVGIISIGDVVKRLLDDLRLEANVLRDAYIATRSAVG
jgi:CBS domain-containing protein